VSKPDGPLYSASKYLAIITVIKLLYSDDGHTIHGVCQSLIRTAGYIRTNYGTVTRYPLTDILAGVQLVTFCKYESVVS